MSFRLASAFVELGTRDRGLRTGFAAAKQNILGILGGLGAAFGITFGAAAAVGLGKFAISAAADAEEIQSKFDEVFKDLSGEVGEFADEFANRIGRSTVETKRQLAEFQDLFVPLGFGRSEAAKLSKQLTELTADVASFNNKTDADVQRDFNSALVGAIRSVRKYGIVITEARLDQELLSMGIDGGVKAATEQQKVMARLNLILKGTTDAQGDAERTAGSFTNRLKAFNGAIFDLAADIGGLFTPALADALGEMTSLVRVTQDATSELRTLQDQIGLVDVGFRSFDIMRRKAELFGAKLATIFDPSRAAVVAKLQADLFREELQLFLDVEQAKQRAGQGAGKRTPADVAAAADRQESLSGFFGIDELSKRIQEQTLKGTDPQKKMVGLMERDQLVQQRMANAMEEVARNTQQQAVANDDVGVADR